MSTENYIKLVKEQLEPLEKMNKQTLQEECKMWRNLWSWLATEVKYYTSRTGANIGIAVRNYHRYVGPLLETHWQLTEIEVGVYEKVYDQTTGEYYYERKIVKVPVGQIVALDWIEERVSETQFNEQLEKEEETEKTDEGVEEPTP